MRIYYKKKFPFAKCIIAVEIDNSEFHGLTDSHQFSIPDGFPKSYNISRNVNGKTDAYIDYEVSPYNIETGDSKDPILYLLIRDISNEYVGRPNYMYPAHDQYRYTSCIIRRK